MTIKIEGEEQNMASYHIQYQILHETLFNHLCEVNSGVNIPPGNRKLKGDELDVSISVLKVVNFLCVRACRTLFSTNFLFDVIMLVQFGIWEAFKGLLKY